MSSRIVCPCGHQLGTNLFEGNGVHMAISDDAYDAVADPVDRTKLATLFLGGRALLECPACGRLLLRDRTGTTYTAYVREPP
jgi:hypothetical protein